MTDAQKLAAYGTAAELKYRRESEAADKGLLVYDAYMQPIAHVVALLSDAAGNEIAHQNSDTLFAAHYHARTTLHLLADLRVHGPDWVAEDCDAIAGGICDGFADLLGALEKRVEARRRDAWLDGSDAARDAARVANGEI